MTATILRAFVFALTLLAVFPFHAKSCPVREHDQQAWSALMRRRRTCGSSGAPKPMAQRTTPPSIRYRMTIRSPRFHSGAGKLRRLRQSLTLQWT
jgi:hypothetical protein